MSETEHNSEENQSDGTGISESRELATRMAPIGENLSEIAEASDPEVNVSSCGSGQLDPSARPDEPDTVAHAKIDEDLYVHVRKPSIENLQLDSTACENGGEGEGDGEEEEEDNQPRLDRQATLRSPSGRMLGFGKPTQFSNTVMKTRRDIDPNVFAAEKEAAIAGLPTSSIFTSGRRVSRSQSTSSYRNMPLSARTNSRGSMWADSSDAVDEKSPPQTRGVRVSPSAGEQADRFAPFPARSQSYTTSGVSKLPAVTPNQLRAMSKDMSYKPPSTRSRSRSGPLRPVCDDETSGGAEGGGEGSSRGAVGGGGSLAAQRRRKAAEQRSQGVTGGAKGAGVTKHVDSQAGAAPSGTTTDIGAASVVPDGFKAAGVGQASDVAVAVAHSVTGGGSIAAPIAESAAPSTAELRAGATGSFTFGHQLELKLNEGPIEEVEEEPEGDAKLAEFRRVKHLPLQIPLPGELSPLGKSPLDSATPSTGGGDKAPTSTS
eukprot:TRINITY_DN388_c0_g1_i2.p1 TRINITY_DN388_c0_g1~~TRINITY_DN388_c0_g1_i2.p1  ORF type:complete len:489 (-),score=102.13 TRINITY_DN388_c0_g1_i2:741-2207(-)